MSRARDPRLPLLRVWPHQEVGVAVFVVRERGGAREVLLMERAGGGMEGTWCPVTGRVETGEQPHDAALRELREETGIAIDTLRASATWKTPTEAGGRIQIHVFCARVASSARVVLNREHSAFDWFDPQAALERMPLTQQRSALRAVLEEWTSSDLLPGDRRDRDLSSEES